MGFLMKHHIETGGGQLPAKLSSLFIKVSGAAWLMRWICDQKTPEVCLCVPGTLRVACRAEGWGVSEPVGLGCRMVCGRLPNFFFFFFLAQLFVKSLPYIHDPKSS